MKLYRFDFRDYLDKSIKRSELECEEKPKTYVLKDREFRTCIPKEEIGTVQSSAWLYVLLLEDDFEKARSIYLDFYSRKIEIENVRHEQQIKKFHRRVKLIKESKE